MAIEDAQETRQEKRGIGEDSISENGKQKNAGLPSYIIKLFQLLAASVAVVILMIIVSYFVSTAIVNQRSVSTYPITSGVITNKVESLAWYENLDEIRVMTRDNPPKQVIVKVSLGYDETNLAVQTELIRGRVPLQDLVRQYLSQRTSKELMNEALVKSELKAAINNLMSMGEVKQVAFNSLNIIEY